MWAWGSCEEEEAEILENVLEGRSSKQETGKQRLRECFCIVSAHVAESGVQLLTTQKPILGRQGW